MIRSSNPILFYNNLRILQVKDERRILVQVDMLPVNLKLGEEFYIQNGNSLILCQVRKLYTYSYQQTQHMFKGEYCYMEIEIKSIRSFENIIQQESEVISSNPVNAAYQTVLERFRNELKSISELAKTESPEKVASRINQLASKYRNSLKIEIQKNVNEYNRTSDKKLIGNELQKQIQFVLKNFEDVVRDAVQAVMKKPETKKFISFEEVI